MITKPQLPPKAGYVEVEVDGRRTYKNATTGVLIEDEQALPDPIEQLRLDIYASIAEVGYELALLKIGGGRDVV